MAQKKKKKPAVSGALVKLSIAKLIIEKGRKFQITSCLITEDWKESGICSIVVVRTRPNGSRIFGIYLLDTYCLGLKDTFYRALDSKEEEDEFLEHFSPTEGYTEIDPMLAFNIIYGAIEYAEDLGLQPAKEFVITQYLLPPIDEIDFIDVEFGQDGKPLFLEGPYDAHRRAKVLAALDKSVGSGNYNYIVEISPDDIGDLYYADEDDADDNDADADFDNFEEVS